MIYLIRFNNYMGEDTFEAYRHRQKAIKRFKELRKEAKSHMEFQDDVPFIEVKEYNVFSFFDPNYNEFSTFISFNTYSPDEFFED